MNCLIKLLLRSRDVAGHWSTEILGAEDILQPWTELPSSDGLAAVTAWRAVEPTRVAVLDDDFVLAAARWPMLTHELLRRALRRSRILATLLGVSSIHRLDDRVLVRPPTLGVDRHLPSGA